LAVPEKIFILESRASLGSAASLASCAGAFGVHTAPRGSTPPVRFTPSTTRSFSLPSTHLCADRGKGKGKGKGKHSKDLSTSQGHHHAVRQS
jgi:hypothetical protein